MNEELIGVIDLLAKTKRISKDVLFEALESALISSYRKNYGTSQNVKVSIDRETGKINFYSQKEVVEDDNLFDDNLEISLTEAKKIDSKILKYTLLMAVTIVIGFTFYEVTGGGHGLLEEMAHKRFPVKYILAILILKLFYTTFCYGSGVQGGIFLPVLVIGGSCGALIFAMLENGINVDQYYINFIILGMSGMLASVVRSPILSVILVSEMAASFQHLIALSIVVIVSYYVAESLEIDPIYETLFERQLEDKNLLVPNETDLGNYSILEYTIVDGLDVIDKKLKEIKFPRHILIISIERDNKEFVPNAEDKILLGDKITVLLNTEDALEIDEYLKIE